jgi:hypothetical protein
MRTYNRLTVTALVLISAAFSLPALAEAPASTPTVSVSVFVNSGLNNPRGLRFGPDGYLYVAEGGTGGSNQTTEAQCMQVPGAGPYKGSPTGGRISRIDAAGNRTTVTDTFASSQTSDAIGSLVSGVADVAFIGNTMYALLAGAGCSHGVPGTTNGIARVNSDGTWKLIADLSAFQMANPVAHPEPTDFEPDGTWWSMVAVHGDFYAVEPNHGELVKVTPKGKITRVSDISASQGHIVPTSIAYNGRFYVSNLGRFTPGDLNRQGVYQISRSGHVRQVVSGLSKVLGMVFDERDRLYVLETSYSPTDPGPNPFTGRLLRILPNGQQQVLIDSSSNLLFFPTGMTFGPDGALYISNIGFGPPPIGLGQILRVEIPDCGDDHRHSKKCRGDHEDDHDD